MADIRRFDCVGLPSVGHARRTARHPASTTGSDRRRRAHDYEHWHRNARICRVKGLHPLEHEPEQDVLRAIEGSYGLTEVRIRDLLILSAGAAD